MSKNISKLSLEQLIEYVAGLNGDTIDEYNYIPPDNQIKILKSSEMERITNFPDTLKEYFENFETVIYRYGVKQYFINKKENYNISLYMSLLTLIDSEFLNMLEDQKVTLAKKLHDTVLTDFIAKNLYHEFNYRELGFKKINMKKDLENYIHNDQTLHYISDYFNLNIFIIDIDKQDVNIYYGEEKFNRFKMNIFLTSYKGGFEPLIIENEKLIKYDNPFFEFFINNNSDNFKVLKDKEFKLGSENLSKYIPTETVEETSKEEISKDENSEVSNKFDEILDTELDDSDSVCSALTEENDETFIEVNMSMTVKKLQEIAKNHNIDITAGILKNGKSKYKTKKELFTLLIKKN
ncbi:MAG: hypothetical protein CMF62_02730 [Magnetococcales bacterium]|nr:hypothetical protein [Magnetococcales bacterium]